MTGETEHDRKRTDVELTHRLNHGSSANNYLQQWLDGVSQVDKPLALDTDDWADSAHRSPARMAQDHAVASHERNADTATNDSALGVSSLCAHQPIPEFKNSRKKGENVTNGNVSAQHYKDVRDSPVISIRLPQSFQDQVPNSCAGDPQTYSPNITEIQSPSKKHARRPRHRTRPDKYEFHIHIEKGKRLRINKKEPKMSNRKHGTTGAILNENFDAPNVVPDRLTLERDTGRGLFNKSKISGTLQYRDLPDLAFTKMKFLESQTRRTKIGSIRAGAQQVKQKTQHLPVEDFTNHSVAHEYPGSSKLCDEPDIYPSPNTWSFSPKCGPRGNVTLPKSSDMQIRHHHILEQTPFRSNVEYRSPLEYTRAAIIGVEPGAWRAIELEQDSTSAESLEDLKVLLQQAEMRNFGEYGLQLQGQMKGENVPDSRGWRNDDELTWCNSIDHLQSTDHEIGQFKQNHCHSDGSALSRLGMREDNKGQDLYDTEMDLKHNSPDHQRRNLFKGTKSTMFGYSTSIASLYQLNHEHNVTEKSSEYGPPRPQNTGIERNLLRACSVSNFDAQPNRTLNEAEIQANHSILWTNTACEPGISSHSLAGFQLSPPWNDCHSSPGLHSSEHGNLGSMVNEGQETSAWPDFEECSPVQTSSDDQSHLSITNTTRLLNSKHKISSTTDKYIDGPFMGFSRPHLLY